MSLWQLSIDVPPDLADSVGEIMEANALSLNIDFVDDDTQRLVAFYNDKPTPEFLAMIEAMAGSAPACEPMADDAGWIAATNRTDGAGRVGSFQLVDAPSTATQLVTQRHLHVVAPLAFGDGYHATTQGCLQALDWIKGQRPHMVSIADIGCGTGVLALAAHKLWPQAQIVASDIDPVSVAAARTNADQNAGSAIRIQQGAGFTGVDGTYQLIVMNILAGLLTRLSHDAALHLAPGGLLVLSGILPVQARLVLAAYRRQRLALIRQSVQDGWVTLILTRRARL